MTNINVKDYSGKEISGSWNGKTYSSKVTGCVRIYLNNKEYNVSEEVINHVGADVKKDANERKAMKRHELIESMSNEDKILLFRDLFYDEVQKEIDQVDARTSQCIHNTFIKMYGEF